MTGQDTGPNACRILNSASSWLIAARGARSRTISAAADAPIAYFRLEPTIPRRIEGRERDLQDESWRASEAANSTRSLVERLDVTSKREPNVRWHQPSPNDRMPIVGRARRGARSVGGPCRRVEAGPTRRREECAMLSNERDRYRRCRRRAGSPGSRPGPCAGAPSKSCVQAARSPRRRHPNVPRGRADSPAQARKRSNFALTSPTVHPRIPYAASTAVSA